ncbi:MAG TPA: sortase [Actinomycetota bacterium]
MQDVEPAVTGDDERLAAERREAIRRRRRRQGRALWIVGLLLLLSALGVGGYVGWLLWGTGLTTKAAQADLRPDFAEKVASRPVEEAPEPGRVVEVPGGAVAILRIPAIELNYVVVEGTDTESLKKGPGHYARTAYPWEDTGRVGIAGHRTTYGAPFWSVDELERGDRIALATEYGIFNYRVTEVRIVDPDTRSVLAQTTRPTLVLTTCHPRFSAAQRLIVFADRVGG